MRRLVLALQFLTRLPLPRVAADERDFAGAMRWFPAAGLAVGAVVAGAAWAGARIDPWIAALAALAGWVWVTGGLHLDGLADVADAAGAAHRDPARLRAVLADPHIGSFGAVAVALQIAAKLVLLHGAVGRGVVLPLVLVPVAARIGPLWWMRSLPPLHDGLAARFRVGRGDLAVWTGLLLAAAWIVPALIAAPVAALLWGLWIARRIGGISGDGHGGGIEVVETALLLALAVAG